METIFYNEFWVINNSNISENSLSPLLSVLHCSCHQGYLKIGCRSRRATSGTTSPTLLCRSYSKKLTVLCCGYFWLWPNKLTQHEEYRLLKDRDNTV